MREHSSLMRIIVFLFVFCCGTGSGFMLAGGPKDILFSSDIPFEESIGGDSIDHEVKDIEEFVLTSRRIPVKTSSTTPVQTISASEITELGILNMADAVKRFAGVNVKDYGGIGGLKTVSVRNLGTQHTTVSYDGIPVSNCQAGQVDIGRFSLDNVGLLSLAVGQTGDLLQAAGLYSSAAVIGIQTEKPIFPHNRNFVVRGKISGGSFGYVSPNFRYWQKLTEGLTLTVDATFMRADGAYPFTISNGKETIKEKRNNSEISSVHSEVNLRYQSKKDGEVNLKGYYFYSKRGLPGAVTLYNPVSTEKLWDENAFIQARFKKSFSRKWSLQALGKYNYGWNKDRETGPQFYGGVYEALHRQNEYYLSATVLFRPIESLSMALAQDGVVNTLRSTMTGCPDPDRLTSLTALSVRWEKTRFNLSATLTGTYLTERVKRGDCPSDISRLNPSFSFNVRPFLEIPFYVRALYKTTFRVPSFNDLYYDRLGSRYLKPEKASEFDLGLTWSLSGSGILEYISLTCDGYINNVKDKIVAFPTTYAWRMTNYGKVRITGLDFTLASSVCFPADFKLVATGSYTLQKAIDLTNPKAPNYKGQIPYTPEHSGNLSLLLENPWVNVAYSLTGVGKRYYMAENIKANEIEGYVEQNLTLTRNLNLDKVSLLLQGELVNIGNVSYQVIKFYPMPGRSWRLSATLTF